MPDGQRRPTKANEGQRKLTKANEGTRRPTQANEGQRGPTQTADDDHNHRQWQGGARDATHLKPWACIFFFFLCFITLFSLFISFCSFTCNQINMFTNYNAFKWCLLALIIMYIKQYRLTLCKHLWSCNCWQSKLLLILLRSILVDYPILPSINMNSIHKSVPLHVNSPVIVNYPWQTLVLKATDLGDMFKSINLEV